MIPETMAQAPEVSPDSWEWLKMLVSPTVSTGTYFKTVLPQVAIEQILCTRARCFADKAGKVFASLIKVTSGPNTKLSNNRRLKTLLWERQFMGFCLSRTKLYFMSTLQDSIIEKLWLHERSYAGLITHCLK